MEELNIEFKSRTSANITWSEPNDKDGFKGLLTYTVKYYRCPNKSQCDITNATFHTAKTNLKTTNAVISNLKFNEMYKFRVYSMRSLKNVTKWNFENKTYIHTGL